MIFYFSGTGNSKWAAEELARRTGDDIFNIAERKKIPDISEEKRIGFVFPVYAWGAPQIVVSFAENSPKTQAFSFGICTCGGDAGLAMKRFSKTYALDSSYSLIMPNNYIVGTDLEEEQVILAKLSAAEKKLEKIACEISEEKRVYHVQEGRMAWIKSVPANFGFNRFARSTHAFYVTETCCGCGLCAENCPASAITMTDGKPVWNGSCFQCMRCIHECPGQAVQYGKKTEGRRRYTIRKYLRQNKLQ